MGENQAYLCKTTGKIYLHSEFGDNFEELPDDLDDEKYIEIPHKNELDLGKDLVFQFIDQYLPNELDKVESIFRKKGAYSSFKSLLERNDRLDQWYEFELKANTKALNEWCELNSIKLKDYQSGD